MRVMRGADVPSDHHLLVTTVQLKLKKNVTTGNQRPKFNVGMLKDKNVQEKFSTELSNRFQLLQDMLGNDEIKIEDMWNTNKRLWLDSSEHVLGRRKQQQRTGYQKIAILEMEARRRKRMTLNQSRTRTTKARAQAEYTPANAKVKESIKMTKRTTLGLW